MERDVLALYDGTRETAPASSRIHRQLEMPLNHLGYRVTYHDIATGLPDPATLGNYAAVVTWFGERLPNYHAYLDWAAHAAEHGTRFVIMDFVGSPLATTDLPQVNKLLKNIGLAARSIWVPPEARPAVTSRDDRMSSSEHRLETVPGFMVFAANRKIASTHLSVSAPDIEGSGKSVNSDVVVTGPGGGFIQYGFGQIYDQQTQRLKWVTDPIAFLSRALGRDKSPWPAPDTTTLAGRRIFFSHIDGDGWNNVSEFHNGVGAPYSVAEVVRDRLISRFPTLPVAIGPIACDFSTPLGGSAKASLVARDLFEMKNVEVASHTHSHPYKWNFFADYARGKELALHSARPELSSAASERPGEALPLLRSAYDNAGPDMPRANFVEPFDLAREVTGALDASTALAPANKKARLYLWSGDTSPFEAAIAATRAANVRNMNGGDSRFDTEFPSLSYVPPIGKPVGKERQIYAVNSNENTYTEGWTRDFGAQARVTETWDNTDRPRRLKGMNVYYHMYAGQKPDSVAAVEKLLVIGRDTPVIPIPASQYAAIADSFYSTEIMREGPSSWSVYDRGNLDTIRLDGHAAQAVDLKTSSGVLGYRAHNNDLYVALDPADTKPRISLAPPTGVASATTPYLVESRWQLSRLERRQCGFTIKASGFGRGEMVWNGLHPGRYAVTAVPLETASQKVFDIDVAGDGVMRLDLDIDAVAGVDLDVACTFTPPAAPILSVAAPDVAARPTAALKYRRPIGPVTAPVQKRQKPAREKPQTKNYVFSSN